MHDTVRRLSGAVYQGFLYHVHRGLAPQSYLEIGTSDGASLAYANCDSIAVDPSFALKANASGTRRRTFPFQMTSDEFFRTQNVRSFFPLGVDLAFLDGMHRFEYLLRDVINTETVTHRRSLILLHDCLPSNARMASRVGVAGPPEEGETATWWSGDVWKIVPILRKYRSDLRIHVLDCPPTGLVALSRLDPESTVLDRNYHAILDEFAPLTLEDYGLERLWGEYPLIDTQRLLESPDQLTALLGVA